MLGTILFSPHPNCVCVYAWVLVWENIMRVSHCVLFCAVKLIVRNGDAINQETAPIGPFLINWPNHCCGNNYKGEGQLVCV